MSREEMDLDEELFEIFSEEAAENLDTLESGLLTMEERADAGEGSDAELVDAVFRAAHNIKGAAGSFGLTDVSELTHRMETLLDQVRAGTRELGSSDAQALLRGVDCLRELVAAGAQVSAALAERSEDLQRALDALMDRPEAPAEKAEQPSERGERWGIVFRPDAGILNRGNDPLRILRGLSGLGELMSFADYEALPPFETLNPVECHLEWSLALEGEVPRSAIEEEFAWVAEESELRIEALHVEGAPATEAEEIEAPAPASATSETPAPEPAPASASPPSKSGETSSRVGAESSSIRVAIEKVDALVNMVGELVITQSMLSQLEQELETRHLGRLHDGLSQLARNTRELQESVMRIRMLPIRVAFNRLPRIVRDLTHKLGREVELRLGGESTELDKTVLEKIGDPLVHLVRNALDHGIEPPDERRELGKPVPAVLDINAYHAGGAIVIEVRDDGRGIDPEKVLAKARKNGLVGEGEVVPEDRVLDLIFASGFSTAETVSEVSGRGVGMDVVRRNVKALGGQIDVDSQVGKGSVFTVRLPLTLAILDGQLVRVAGETYVVPLTSIVESLQVQKAQARTITGRSEVYQLRSEHIAIVRLHEIFGLSDTRAPLTEGLVVVVEAEGRKVGLYVDELLGQQQVVIKSLESNFEKVDGLSGATILGDGTVALILDVAGMLSLAGTPASSALNLQSVAA